MRKTILFLFFILSINSYKLYAQAWNEKSIVITTGYGFPNLYKYNMKSSLERIYNEGGTWNNNTSIKTTGYGPWFLKFDYGLSKLIGLGLVVGQYKANAVVTHHRQIGNSVNNTTNWTNYDEVSEYKLSSFSLGARLNFHFGTKDKLDPYAGIGAGYTYNDFSYKFTSYQPNQNNGYYYYEADRQHYYIIDIPVYFSMTVGMRYYFTKNIGIYGELGIDKLSFIQGGLAIKF